MTDIPPLFKYRKTDHTVELCTSVLRFKHIAFSTGHLPGFQVYLLSFFLAFFCRDKYNWPEEIDIVGDIVWTAETQLLSEELVCKFSIIM